MRKNTKFLCFLTTFAALVVCLGATGLDDEAQVEYDEHLFIAGNDSTGTASITYASRFNPQPITIRFENFSYPDSCALHPSRCRNLTYLMSTTDDNRTQLIFYVPLTKSALGVMEFVRNRTTLSHVQTRAVYVPEQCSPISVITFFRTLHLLCLVDSRGEGYIKLCEVRNTMSVKDVWLSCSLPQNIPRFNLSRLSNFVVYGNGAFGTYIYFTYENAMHAKVPSLDGHVNRLSFLPPGYTYCRYLNFVNSSTPLIASYCYTDANQIQVVYFDLITETFVEQSNASRVVSYHCPSSETFVEVAIGGAFASFWQGMKSRGSFNIIGHSVLFARCFEFGGSLHFLYNDERLGTFIKPHISRNLRETVEQLSVEGCVNPACEQPVIFENRYVLVQFANFNSGKWTLQVVDIERGWNNSLLTFTSSSTSQLALISNFEYVPMVIPPGTTSSPDIVSNSTPPVITVSVTVSTVVFVVIIVVVVLLLVFYSVKRRNQKGERRSYSFVPANPSGSRQQSPMGRDPEMEMDNLSDEQSREQQSTSSSASSTTELVAGQNEDMVHSNPATFNNLGNNRENFEPGALDRESYGVIGSSRSTEDMQRSGNSVVTYQQPHPPPALSEQTSIPTQEPNATAPQQPADSAQMLPHEGAVSLATAATVNAIPLCSQHSNDSTTNSTSSGSVYVPAYSQATRPQASPSSTLLPPLPPPPTNLGTAKCPSRMNSTESNTSHTSCNSDGHVSSATTPAGVPLNAHTGTPSSLIDLSPAATAYTHASQTSLHQDNSGYGSLPMDRNAYSAVGCSQEDVQRPHQCTQQPAVGQMSGSTNSSTAVGYTGTSSTASTPHQQYGGTMGYTGTSSTSSTPQRQNPGNPWSLGVSPSTAGHNGVIRYNSQHSNDSTGSAGSSSVPDNSISVHTFHSQPNRRQSLSSAPFVHNQATGPNYMCYNNTSRPPDLNRTDSNTSQNSGVGIHTSTPTDSSTLIFFPSSNQGTICPPSHVPLSAAQHATNTT